MQSAYEPSNVTAMAVVKRVGFNTVSTIDPTVVTVIGDRKNDREEVEPTTSGVGGSGEGGEEDVAGGSSSPPPQSAFEIILSESKLLRWRLVPLMGILGFGSFYNLDIPGAIGMGEGDTIQSRFIAAAAEVEGGVAIILNPPQGGSNHTTFNGGNIYTNAMNQQLYSMYYYPGIVVPLISGVLLDRVIGPRNAVIVFCSLIALGSFIFAIGVTHVSYATMVVGRFISGTASETTMILRSYFVSRFFKRGTNIRGVALAFGLAVGASRMGSVVTFPMTVAITSAFGVPTACFAGTFAAMFTLGCGLLLNHYDAVAEDYGMVPQQAHLIAKAKERETREETRTLKRLTRPMSLQSVTISPGFSRTHSISISTPTIKGKPQFDDDDPEAAAASDPTTTNSHTNSRSATPHKQRRRRGSSLRYDAPMSPVCGEAKVQEALAVISSVEKLDSSLMDEGEDEQSALMKLWSTLSDRFHPKRFKKLNIAFWTACLASNFFFPAIFPFFAFAKPFFEKKWGVDESTAVFAITVYQTASVVGCPTFGLLSDSIGRNNVLLAVGSVGAFCMHLLLATSYITPILILLSYGTFHGIFVGGFQPTPALIVNQDELGLAFGVIGALNCLGVSITPAIVGYILDMNTEHVVLPSGAVTTRTALEGYIDAEYVLLSFVAVCVVFSMAFLVADRKVLQGVVFASPTERVAIFKLKDAAHADAEGKEKGDMEQRIRDAADALMVAFNTNAGQPTTTATNNYDGRYGSHPNISDKGDDGVYRSPPNSPTMYVRSRSPSTIKINNIAPSALPKMQEEDVGGRLYTSDNADAEELCSV